MDVWTFTWLTLGYTLDPIVTGAEKRKKELQVAPLFTKRTRRLENDLASRVVTQTRHKVDPFLTNTTPSYNTLTGVLLKGKTTHGKRYGVPNIGLDFLKSA